VKRLFNIFPVVALTVLYLLVTTGFEIHQCEICHSRDIISVGVFSDNTKCCSSEKNKKSCHTTEDSNCCKSKQHTHNHNNTLDYTLSDNCCSLTYEFLKADYTNSKTFSLKVVYNPLLFVANLTTQENISNAYCYSATAHFSPPNLFGETLPIYYFCQLRL